MTVRVAFELPAARTPARRPPARPPRRRAGALAGPPGLRSRRCERGRRGRGFPPRPCPRPGGATQRSMNGPILRSKAFPQDGTRRPPAPAPPGGPRERPGGRARARRGASGRRPVAPTHRVRPAPARPTTRPVVPQDGPGRGLWFPAHHCASLADQGREALSGPPGRPLARADSGDHSRWVTTRPLRGRTPPAGAPDGAPGVPSPGRRRVSGAAPVMGPRCSPAGAPPAAGPPRRARLDWPPWAATRAPRCTRSPPATSGPTGGPSRRRSCGGYGAARSNGPCARPRPRPRAGAGAPPLAGRAGDRRRLPRGGRRERGPRRPARPGPGGGGAPGARAARTSRRPTAPRCTSRWGPPRARAAGATAASTCARRAGEPPTPSDTQRFVSAPAPVEGTSPESEGRRSDADGARAPRHPGGEDLTLREGARAGVTSAPCSAPSWGSRCPRGAASRSWLGRSRDPSPPCAPAARCRAQRGERTGRTPAQEAEERLAAWRRSGSRRVSAMAG